MKSGQSLRMGCGVGVVVLGAILIGSAGQPGPAVGGRITARHYPIRIHRLHENGNYTSYNWAGYAVTGASGSVTDVKASWQVPAAQCSATYPNGYSSYWVGMDGWTSNTVEQIGTDSDCVSLNGTPDTPTYYAWFEFYPHPGYLIQFPQAIQPGHIISAEVTATATTGTTGRNGSGRFGGGTMFTVTLTDKTTGYTFTTSSSVSGAQQSSAEWIAEAPCCGSGGNVLPLAPFGLAQFGRQSTGVPSTSWATVGGNTQPLGNFGANIQTTTMVGEHSPTTIKAQPSAISADNSSFSVHWLSPGP